MRMKWSIIYRHVIKVNGKRYRVTVECPYSWDIGRPGWRKNPPSGWYKLKRKNGKRVD
jgi:hypothetical protein